eukprot:COSAG05_NODE_191_length_14617_cov_90.240736_3_plen_46_part_00
MMFHVRSKMTWNRILTSLFFQSLARSSIRPGAVRATVGWRWAALD